MWAWLAVGLCLGGTDDDGPTYRPGLLAEYTAHGKISYRIDDGLSFNWDMGSPATWIPNGPFSAAWNGILLLRPSSRFVFHAYLAGKARVILNGKTILNGERRDAGWISSLPLDLESGNLPLAVEYATTGQHARFALYWECEQFPREPIRAWNVVHLPPKRDYSLLQRGERLVRAYRCIACHDFPLQEKLLPAPSLQRLNGAVHAGWLVEYLQNPTSVKANVAMPDFGLSSAEAHAIGSAVLQKSEKADGDKTGQGGSAAGKTLLQRVGCLACHTLGKLGTPTPFGGGDLSQIAVKRPLPILMRWLKAPNDINPDHRMPVFDLSAKERRDLTAFLATCGSPLQDTRLATSAGGDDLIAAKRCASCHQIPGSPLLKQLSWNSNWRGAVAPCTGAPNPRKNQPGYRLAESDQQAITAYLRSLPVHPVELSQTARSRQFLENNNCLHCHARGNEPGLREVAGQFGATDPKVLAQLVPPPLHVVGDKLQRDWLARAVAGEAPRLRPWLAPRMPRFSFDERTRNALVDLFEQEDRQPCPPADLSLVKPGAMLAAHQLVGSAGFGCMSCHGIGSFTPRSVEPGAQGPDLRFLAKRIHADWFSRWTQNPQRMTPGVEMPAVQRPVPGILGEKLDDQLAALWHALNAPQFDLPTTNAVQLVNTPKARPVIIRDCFELTGGAGDSTSANGQPATSVARAFAVGLPSGHNVLLDLDSLSLRRWWLGDVARQQTRGKSWYWEPAGLTVADWPDAAPLLAIRDKEGGLRPFSARLVGYQTDSRRGSVSLQLRISFDKSSNGSVPVELTLTPTSTGWRLDMTATPVEAGYAPFLCIPTSAVVRMGLGWAKWDSPLGTVEAKTIDAGREMTRGVWQPSRLVPLSKHGTTGWLTAAVEFSMQSHPPAHAPIAAGIGQRKARLLPTVPGYEVIRLPLDDASMPTALAWWPNGDLLVASLKGQVLTARDTDHDGLPDTYFPFSDQLAAPFGLLVEGPRSVLVGHKPELLRLTDRDGDGVADESTVVAAGWGVTTDYHDWTVGPVRGRAGELFLALPCQQDERTSAEAFGRGKVIRVQSNGAWDIFAHGVRFPMGLAVNAAGDLFASDNQGVTNPFNELNHIRQEHHYGFWNKLEKHVPNQVVTEPAIKIPHPWTGSVNGITFVPNAVGFEQFAGHLIGAEYTTRRLVRMSLQKVGDTYQGCVYPFSIVDPGMVARDETFLGPIAVAFGPDNCLYVGSMIDSGWGGGNNRGAIERVRHAGPLPLGIREVRAHRDGFDIDFTGPVDASWAGDPKSFSLSCYRRIHKSGYATPDQDRTPVVVKSARISVDQRTVHLTLDALHTGFVYDIGLVNTVIKFFPAEAHYTLNQLLSDHELP